MSDFCFLASSLGPRESSGLIRPADEGRAPFSRTSQLTWCSVLTSKSSVYWSCCRGCEITRRVDPFLGTRQFERFYFKDRIGCVPRTGSNQCCSASKPIFSMFYELRLEPVTLTFTLNGTKVCGFLAATNTNYDRERSSSPLLWHTASLFFC